MRLRPREGQGWRKGDNISKKGFLQSQIIISQKNRLETMVDGILAIAMTLLTWELIHPDLWSPRLKSCLRVRFLAGSRRSYFFAAFFNTPSFWLNHHRQFQFVSTVDPHLLWINIILLVSIVFIPFSTDVAGDYPEVQIAVLLFHINIMIVGFIFVYQIYYISESRRLCDPETDRNFLRLHLLQSLLIPGVAFIAAIVSFILPWGSLLTYMVIPIARYSFFNLMPQSGTC